MCSDHIFCHNCSTQLNFSVNERIGRKEECPKCYADLRCCKMCLFYDPSAYNECREPVAQRILEKEKANFCDYYKIGKSQNNIQQSDLINIAESLFKK